MSNIGFIFPGQGSQFTGMGKELYDCDSDTRLLFETASDIIGQDLADLCFNGPEEKLGQTVNTQPALLTVSYAFFKYLRKKNQIIPKAVAGHSLGEYSALTAISGKGFPDILKLVQYRASLMEKAEGSMAAIIGLKADLLSNITEKIGEVWPANFNCPGQIVIAGRQAAVEQAIEESKNQGAKIAKRLDVSIPSHCPLMAEAAAEFKTKLEEISFKLPSIPIIQNYSAREPRDLEELKSNLTCQLSSPVRWEKSINRMISMGIDDFIEIGPGKVLAGLVKRIDRKVSVRSVTEMF